MIFKDDIDLKRSHMASFLIWAILQEANLFALEKNVSLVVADLVTTIEMDKKVNRKHATHREGRAVDISTKGLNEKFIINLIAHLEALFFRYGAVVDETGTIVLINRHDAGSGDHLHIQIHSKYAYPYNAANL